MLKQNGGRSLLDKHNSISSLLSTVYPEYRESCRKLVLQIVDELKLSKPEEVINVPREYPLLQVPQSYSRKVR